MPERCERREMPHEKRVRATIMEDKACYEYHVLSHEAICIFVTLRRPIRTRGQTTHYADNALFDERKSRSLTFDLPSSLRFPHFYEKERRNCQAHTSYALGVPLGTVRRVTCFSRKCKFAKTIVRS